MFRALIAVALIGCGRIGFDELAGPADVAAARAQLSVGGVHSCALRGTEVWCWGDGREGNTGTGNTGVFPLPVKVANLPPAKSVSSGDQHSCAIVEDGRVFCWGYNGNGQTGPQTKRLPSLLAVPFEDPNADPVPGLPAKAVEVSCGNTHSCALLEDHTVYCWGRDDNDQLGRNQSVTSGGTPLEVNATGPVLMLPADMVHLAVDDDSSYALDSAGHVWAWGENGSGQLGTKDTMNRPLPFEIPAITATEIAPGGDHLCVLDDTGKVQCWGANDHGELGVSPDVGSVLLVPVTVPGTYVALDAGTSNTCAVTDNHDVACWGADFHGESGGPDFGSFFEPTQVADISSVVAVSAGNDVTCALRLDDSVKCWGNGAFGNLGNGTLLETKPVTVSGLANTTLIAAGDTSTCALVTGAMQCWGENNVGQLGNGTFTDFETTPVAVTQPWTGNVQSLSMGFAHTCVVVSGGELWCWGNNDGGQVGDGTTDPVTTPVKITIPPVATVDLGGDHSCALTTTNEVYCWGRNDHGQLGDGTTTEQHAPKQVPGAFTGLAVGDTHVCAITVGGPQCWGLNEDGQIGDGGFNDALSPTTVPGVAGSTIWAFGASTCISGGAPTECWGLNVYNILLGGSNGQETVPVASALAPGAVGNKFTVCFNEGTALKCVGDDGWGLLGDGSFSSNDVPAAVSLAADATANIAVGTAHVCVALVDGTVQCWGDDTFGQIGNGKVTRTATPSQVLFP